MKRHWMPNAPEEEIQIAALNIRGLLMEFEEIYDRLEREGYWEKREQKRKAQEEGGAL